MNKRIVVMAMAAMLALCGSYDAGARKKGSKKSTFTISTVESGADVKGYKGPVPVEVTFVKGRVSAVKALPNRETPSYFRRVLESGLLDSWNGLTPEQAAKHSVDGVTGATFSSRALIENVRIAAREAAKR